MNEQQDSADITAAVAAMGIDMEAWRQRQRFVGFGSEDAVLLREMGDIAERHVDATVDRFYENIEGFPELVALIRASGSTIERLKTTQRHYLRTLFGGDYGAAYLEQRLRVGVVHYRIGLDPRWYLGSYSVYSQLLLPLARKRYPWNRGRQERAAQAITKLLSLDSQLALDTYVRSLTRSVDAASMSRIDVDRRVVGYRRFIANVATGDLTHRIEVTGDDELASLGDQLNDMVNKLASMARAVNEASSSTMVATEELQQSVSSQSAGAAQQASAVSETATTLEEIRVTSNQTRDKAHSLGQAAERTREEGERGVQTVQGSAAAMQDIRNKVESIARNILALSEQTQQIGDITGLHGTHGVALDTAGKFGYISDGGGNAVVVFNRATLAKVATIPAQINPDAILFEPATKTVWAFNGRSHSATVISAATRKVVATIPLPGKPEFAVADGHGTIFNNIEDKSEMIRIDARTHKVTATWPAGCESPSGLAFDGAGHRLFPVCDGNKMAVLDSNTGKLLATAHSGDGPDAARWSAACMRSAASIVEASQNGRSASPSFKKRPAAMPP